MLRDRASGPEIGLPGVPVGKAPNRPSGRPKAGRGADFEAPTTNPAEIRTENLISGPEALFYLRLVTHFEFLSAGPDQKMFTKRH
jgi:hypothetical protein